MAMPAKKARWVPRSPRFRAPLPVEARTFGCNYGFDLQAENISQTGLLVGAGADILPFREHTLVELVIDPNSQHLKKPMKCTGKVIRVESETPGVLKFGIQLSDITAVDARVWQDYIETYDPADSIDAENQKDE